MVRLDRIWKSNISFQTKFKLYKAMVVSILLYGCKALTSHKETEARSRPSKTNASDDSSASRTENIKPTNVHNTARNMVGPQDHLLATIMQRKLMSAQHLN